MTYKQFFTLRACTVDMNAMRNKPVITDDDIIVCVECIKSANPYYVVYYLSNIYHDDRQYKCRAHFYTLPAIVIRWMEGKVFTENAIMKRWY